MTDVVLFHHVQGRTDGVLELAEHFRDGGHTVHVPDLFDGERPDSLEEGMALVRRLGDDVVDERVEAAVADLPQRVVYAGISFGVMAAQRLAQTRPGAVGALLYEACVPVTGDWAFGPWPPTVAVQVHGMEQDPFFGLEGDLDAARELVEVVGSGQAEVFVYAGDQHLFTDSSLPSYDVEAASLLRQRSLVFLDRLG